MQKHHLKEVRVLLVNQKYVTIQYKIELIS